MRRVRVAAEGATKEKSEDKKEDKKDEKKPFTPPSLDPSTPAPIFGGSTGGLLRKAQVCDLLPLSLLHKRSCISALKYIVPYLSDPSRSPESVIFIIQPY